jgi:dipeptidase E
VTPERNIVAIGGAAFADEAAPLLAFLLGRARAERPRVVFLPTASGDAREAVVRFYEAFARFDCRVAHVELFGRPERERVERALLGADVVYVGGGNTANMLAIWRVHGVDTVLRRAWERGVVLGGTSAGANCWFEACTPDSFGPIVPLEDGLGFLRGSFCPHYDAEPDRRPTYLRLVAAGFPPGYAAEDGAALHFRGLELVEAVAAGGARALRVGSDGETALEMRVLG